MRDAVICGSELMIRLNAVITELGVGSVWNFVHVVLTDGDDGHSSQTLEETCAIMYLIGQTVKVSSLKTYFIGVGLTPGSMATRELQALANCGGENAEFLNINNSEINDIFEQIKVSIGLLERTQMVGIANDRAAILAVKKEVNPFLVLEKQRFVVLFTLDMSGSMSGDKWRRVNESVGNFISQLGNEDLVAGIVFNEAVVLVTKNPPLLLGVTAPQQRQQQQRVQQPQRIAPPQQQPYRQPLIDRGGQNPPFCTKNKIIISLVIVLIVVIAVVLYLIVR